METIRVEVPGKGIVEFPDGTPPEVMERALAEFAEAKAEEPRHPYATPPLNDMTREERMAHYENHPMLVGAMTGGFSPGMLAGGIGKAVKRLAEPVMDMAFGAQAGVKSKASGLPMRARRRRLAWSPRKRFPPPGVPLMRRGCRR
jgi:hypothetical protein